MSGRAECNPRLGCFEIGKGPNRSGCGNGHRGRSVGTFFTIVEGRVVHQPPGTSLFAPGWKGNEERLPVWHPKPIYNTQHLWCCEGCMVEHSSTPESYDAPREAYIYETCFAAGGGGCVGAGELYGFVPPVFGLCGAQEGDS